MDMRNSIIKEGIFSLYMSDPVPEDSRKKEPMVDGSAMVNTTIFKLDLGRDCYVKRVKDGDDIVIRKYENGKATTKRVSFPLRRWKVVLA